MDYYYNEGRKNKRGTARWVVNHFKRPTFGANSIRQILKNEKLIREGKTRGSMNLKSPRAPQWPLLEVSLTVLLCILDTFWILLTCIPSSCV